MKKKTNPLLNLLYLVVVVALLGVLVFYVYLDKQEEAAYEETVAALAAAEAASAASGETEDTSPDDTDTADATESDATDDTSNATAEDTQTDTASAEIDYDATIIVLNGTSVNGVAGYWTSVLEAAGYTDVTAANYSILSDETTTIVAVSESDAAPLLTYFPDAEVEIADEVEGIVSVSEGEVPANVDVWVIIGTDDAVTG